MSPSVFICSIFYTEHPPRELLHILFLAFILSRPHQWCSWCENTKGSRFICHTYRPRTTHHLSPHLHFNVSGLQIPLCTENAWLFHMYSIDMHTQKPCCVWLNYTYTGFLLSLPYTNTHSIHPMTCAAGLWSESMLRKATAAIDCSDLFLFLAHPHNRVRRYFLYSVVVTCKGTCGVAEVVCSGQITSSEIDQPFCLSVHHYPFIPFYLPYLSLC